MFRAIAMSDGHPTRATMAFGIETDDEPSHHLESLRIEPIRNRSHRPGIERSLEPFEEEYMSGIAPSHNRRAFITTGGRALTGIAGILAVGRAPASWAARELNLLTAVNYAPASDVKLDELAKRFTKASGVNVRVDHIQSVQMPAKLSAELMGKSGHDIISLVMHYPWLFQPGLVDVSDICNNLSKKHGEWFTFAKEHALVKGQW